MDFSSWLAFVAVALLVTFSPGPAVVMVISNAVSHGPGRAMIGSLGNALGLIAVAAAATAGLGVVLAASATAFLAVKLLGAAYLIYLGIRQWRSRAPSLGHAPAPGGHAPTQAWRLFAHGVWVALTNPKTILFFSALFPQFVHTDHPVLPQLLVLIPTFAACALLSHAFYALLARGLRTQLTHASRIRLVNRIFGGTFVALGIGLLGLRSKTA
ncbi:LysE family translocator [Comamonadaceae bacterium PP-2]